MGDDDHDHGTCCYCFADCPFFFVSIAPEFVDDCMHVYIHACTWIIRPAGHGGLMRS